jgi:hypothetical protein
MTRDFLKLPHISCFNHTLHLFITDAFDGDNIYSAVLKTAQHLSSSFRRSTKYGAALESIQKLDHAAVRALRLSVATRWNSIHGMFERLLQERTHITQALTTLDRSREDMSREEWAMIEGITPVLAVLASISTNMSSNDSGMLPMVLPMCKVISNVLQSTSTLTQPDSVATTNFKVHLMTRYNHRFQKYQDAESIYAMACALNPTTKGHTPAATWGYLHTRLETQPNLLEIATPSPHSVVQLVPKRRKTAFDDLLEQIEPAQAPSFPSSASLEVQLATYKLVDKTHLNVTRWWQQHAAEFDKIASLALMLVNIPATEAQCERTFSWAGAIKDDTRANLSMNSFLDLLLCFCHRSMYV